MYIYIQANKKEEKTYYNFKLKAVNRLYLGVYRVLFFRLFFLSLSLGDE